MLDLDGKYTYQQTIIGRDAACADGCVYSREGEKWEGKAYCFRAVDDGAANIEEQCGVTTQGTTTRRPAGIMTTGYLILLNMQFCVSVFGKIVQELIVWSVFPILHHAMPPVPTN